MKSQSTNKKGKGSIRRILCVLLAAILLCACQSEAPSGSVSSSAPVSSQSESVQVQTSSDDESNDTSSTASSTAPESKSEPQDSSASAVCAVPFTETLSFPMPFEGELLLDENRLVDINRGVIFPIEQALYDYDTMWLLLEENFPHLNAAQREAGIDWQEIRDAYRTEMEAYAVNGYIPQRNFMMAIKNSLLAFTAGRPVIGHLYTLSHNSDYEYYKALYQRLSMESGRASDKCVYDLLNNQKSEQFYFYEEKIDYSMDSGQMVYKADTDQPKDDAVQNACAVSQNTMTGFVEDEIPYLKITSFSNWDESVYTAVKKFFFDIAGKEHLIIDVRGNGGGSDAIWRCGIVPYLEQSELIWDRFWGLKHGTLNMALQIPAFAGEDVDCYTDDSWKKDFPYISEEALEGIDAYIKNQWRCEKDSTQKSFSGKIWVLIDKECYSATDEFAAFCKDTGFATLVGTTTGGNGRGTQPAMMVLPYSGMVVRYDPYLTFNQDGTYNSMTGTPPDIECGKNMTALEACLQAISKERET